MERKEKGFWASLFDLSFRSFALPYIVPILYILVIVFTVLLILFWLVAAFSQNIFIGLLALVVGAPLLFFLYILSARVGLEVLVILFRIREDLQEMRKEGEGEIKESE